MLKVVIADDHRLILAGIRRALEDDGEFEVVGEASTGEKVLPLVAQTSPDLVVLDLRMPGMDGLICLDQIKKRHPSVKVVVLSVSTDEKLIENVLKRGASAYIVKSVNPVDLPGALRQAVEGNVFSTIGLPDATAAGAAKAAGLTDREAVDPRSTRAGPVQRADRERALGRRADGEVPPDERLPQAGSLQPHRGGALRLPAGPRRQSAVRARIARGIPLEKLDADEASLCALSRFPGADPEVDRHAHRLEVVRPEQGHLDRVLAGGGHNEIRPRLQIGDQDVSQPGITQPESRHGPLH